MPPDSLPGDEAGVTKYLLDLEDRSSGRVLERPATRAIPGVAVRDQYGGAHPGQALEVRFGLGEGTKRGK